MIRFSLATLFLLVLLAALACAALVYASPLVSQVAVTAAVLLLGLAVLIALVGRGRARAAAAGFAFAGWAYLLLANVGALNLRQQLLTSNVNGWLYATLHPPQNTGGFDMLAEVPGWTDEALEQVLLDPAKDADAANGNGPDNGRAMLADALTATQPAADGALAARIGAYERAYRIQSDLAGLSPASLARTVRAPRVGASTFHCIAHALWALLLGLLGAVVAAVIFARAHRKVAAPQENH